MITTKKLILFWLCRGHWEVHPRNYIHFGPWSLRSSVTSVFFKGTKWPRTELTKDRSGHLPILGLVYQANLLGLRAYHPAVLHAFRIKVHPISRLKTLKFAGEELIPTHLTHHTWNWNSAYTNAPHSENTGFAYVNTATSEIWIIIITITWYF